MTYIGGRRGKRGRRPADEAGTIELGGELRVNRLGFGAMRLTGAGVWGWPPDRNRAKEVLVEAVRRGVGLIDTADAYGPFTNETLIQETLSPYPEETVIATKGGLVRDRKKNWIPNGRPEHLKSACEGSLKRLTLDTLDLYQLHAPDPEVPFEESLGALAELREEGKVRLVGLSNVSAEQLRKALAVLPVASVQNRLSLPGSEDQREVLSECERSGLAFLPYAPLSAGSLATTGPKAETVREVAARHGATPAQVALAWLLHHSPVTVPIPGTSSVAHLEENVAAAGLRLSAEEVETLSAAEA